MQRLEAVFSHFSAQNNATSTPFASTHRRNDTLLQQTPLMDSSMSDRRGRGDARNDFLQRDRGRNLYSGKLDMVPEADPPSQRNAAAARPEKENGFPLRHTQSSPLSPTYGRLKGVEQSSAGLLPNSVAYRNPTAHVDHLLLQGMYEVVFDWLFACLSICWLIDWLTDWPRFDRLIDWSIEWMKYSFVWHAVRFLTSDRYFVILRISSSQTDGNRASPIRSSEKSADWEVESGNGIHLSGLGGRDSGL